MTFGSQALIWSHILEYCLWPEPHNSTIWTWIQDDTSTQGILQCKKSQIKRISTHNQTWFYNVAYNILLESSYPNLLKCLDKLLIVVASWICGWNSQGVPIHSYPSYVPTVYGFHGSAKAYCWAARCLRLAISSLDLAEFWISMGIWWIWIWMDMVWYMVPFTSKCCQLDIFNVIEPLMFFSDIGYEQWISTNRVHVLIRWNYNPLDEIEWMNINIIQPLVFLDW